MPKAVVCLLITAIAVLTIGVAPPSAAQAKPAAGAQGHMTMSDAEFAHLMAKHHRGGIEMARLEESAGASAEVKALADKIRQGQERDLPTLQAHGKSAKPSGMVAEHEKQMDREHAAMMAKLKSAKAEALDRAFVASMITHHQDGLEMIEQTQFKDAKLKAVADKMAEEQQREIAELKKHQK